MYCGISVINKIMVEPKRPTWAASWEVGQEYTPVSLLGQGGWGQVCEAIHIETGKRVAIKRVQGVFKNRLKAVRMLREVTLLRKLSQGSDKFVKILDLIDVTN
jgi:serine/threonine protein kinase